MSDLPPLPVLVIFSLDHVLWPFWTEIDHTPPFERHESGQIIDQIGRPVRFYEDVPKILQKLHSDGIKIGAICPTHEVDGVKQLLELFDFKKYIAYTQITKDPQKITQVERIHNETGIQYNEMLYFDDSRLALNNISSILKVHCCHVMAGLEFADVEQGLKEFQGLVPPANTELLGANL